jgi:hypothetical protein
MQPGPTLSIELDSSTGKCGPLPLCGAVVRPSACGVDPAPARRRAERDGIGRFTATDRADHGLGFATGGPRAAAECRPCRAMQSVGLW